MKKLEFKVKLDGMEGSSVAALSAALQRGRGFWNQGPRACARDPYRLSFSFFAYAHGWLPSHGREQDHSRRRWRESRRHGESNHGAGRRCRVVEIPPALKKAMAGNRAAQEKWKKLSFTHQKEMAISIRDAKQKETRQRRLAKVMEVLNSDKKWVG